MHVLIQRALSQRGLAISLIALMAMLLSLSQAQRAATQPPPLTATDQTLTYPGGAANLAITLGATDGTPPYSFSVTQQPTKGTLTGTAPDLVYTLTPGQTGTDTILFSVSDSDSPAATDDGVITINIQPPLALAPTTLPNGMVNLLYANQTITASGGTGPYTFAVTSGALPGGLNLTAGGVFGGTAPTAAGTFNFTITATDSSVPANTGSRAYTVIIVPAGGALTATNQTLIMSAGQTSLVVTLGATGGTAPYTFAIAANPTKGTLSGLAGNSVTYTPFVGQVGTDTFTFTVRDSTNPQQQATGTITIDLNALAVPLQAVNQTLTYGASATSLPIGLSATGGTPPYTFSIVTQPIRGTLAGTPPGLIYTLLPGQTGGQDSFVFSVRDFAGRTTSGAITINIETPIPTATPTPTLTPTPDPRLAFQTAVPFGAGGGGVTIEAARPNDGQMVDSIRPTFFWRGAPGVDEYLIQISIDNTFRSPVYELTARCCNYTLQRRYRALRQGNYFWRVAAVPGGAFTEPLPFTVFIGKRPFDGSWSEDTTPRFTWNFNAGVNNYILQVSDNEAFTDYVINEAVGRATAYVVRDPLPMGRYYWRVFPEGEAPISNISHTFAISTPPPVPPTPLAPAPDAEIIPTDAAFEWELVGGAVEYEIEISESLEFEDAVVLLAEESGALPEAQLVPGTYFWRIRSLNVYGVAGEWSARRVFIVKPFGT